MEQSSINIKTNRLKATLLALCSIFSFSLMALCVKLLLEGSFAFQEIVFFRSLIVALISGLIIRRKKLSFWGSKNNQRTLFFRSLFGYLALLGFFFSLKELPLVASSMVKYMSPVFSGIVAFFLLKESVSIGGIFCLFLGLFGIVISSGLLIDLDAYYFHGQRELSINQVISKESMTYWYWLICLVSTFLTGFAYTFVRKVSISGQKEKPETVVFYFAFFCLLPSLVLLIFDFQIPSFKESFLLLCVGACAYLGQFFLVKALAIEKTAIVTNTSYFGFVFSAIWDFFFFDKVPTLNLLIGIFLIIGSQFFFLKKPST